MLQVVLWVLGVLLALFVAYLLLIIVSAAFVDTRREYDRDSAFCRHLLYSATGICILVMRIRVTVTGTAQLPADGRFLLVSNHRSNFDPLVTWYALRHSQLAFISKPENFSIPFFGRLIRKCCFMPIDRENPREAVKTIRQAAALLEADAVSVAVYPEGTRSKTCELLPFHNGVFKIAQKAHVPIVVAAVSGTEKVAKNFPFHRTTVKLQILETIPAEAVCAVRSAAIGARVETDLREALTQDTNKKEN